MMPGCVPIRSSEEESKQAHGTSSQGMFMEDRVHPEMKRGICALKAVPSQCSESRAHGHTGSQRRGASQLTLPRKGHPGSGNGARPLCWVLLSVLKQF